MKRIKRKLHQIKFESNLLGTQIFFQNDKIAKHVYEKSRYTRAVILHAVNVDFIKQL